MRVNGLYGHVRRNDVRSLALFVGFVLTFHLLAVLALLVPLAMLDPEHSPIYGLWGYLLRWVPIMTALGALVFVVQLAWHVRVVRRRTEFRFVDSSDEPRLCRILEPLILAAGLPTPYVGVIDSPAMNAFACGIRQKDAVLVFTRGLIDGLDDEELAAVAAHELMHIANGDIRLIAATNVCLDTLKLLSRRRTKRVNRIWEAAMMPGLALGLPILFVLVLVVCYLRKKAVDASHLTRRMIAASREFIADAQALQLTQNPAALVSALQRVEGRSALPGLAAGQDAMMIDGPPEGAYATHPSIAERIAAIVATTGSLALVAPARRDSRPDSLKAGGGSGLRVPRLVPAGAYPAAPEGDVLNRFGLTWESSLGVLAAVALFVWMHGVAVLQPRAMAEAFDPRPLRAVFDLAGKGASCQVRGLLALAGGLPRMPADCSEAAIYRELAPYANGGGILGRLAQNHGSTKGLDGWQDGTFRSNPPPAVAAERVHAERCFHTKGYSVGDRGLHSIHERPKEGESISLMRWLAHGEEVARRVTTSDGAGRDGALVDYFKLRKAHGETVHRFFGDPGLEVARTTFSKPEHEGAIALLGERLTDPAFAARFNPVELAEITLLATSPQDFVTCTARKARHP
jgi:Zn-dependent protease with chaperone function